MATYLSDSQHILNSTIMKSFIDDLLAQTIDKTSTMRTGMWKWS